jgi:hypothetical protein
MQKVGKRYVNLIKYKDLMNKNYLFSIFLITLIFSGDVHSGWLCREASSIKSGNTLTTCGIGYGKTEGQAREDGLKKAFKELDSICSRSIDCKNQELLLEPLRNECVKESGQHKCYRALLATITKRKKTKPLEVKPIVEREKKESKVVSKYQCDYKFPEMRDFLKSNKITAAVKRIKQIPFRDKCSKTHYEFLNLMGTMKKYPKSYLVYLYSLVGTFGDNWKDYRPIAIFEYLYGNGDWNKREWKLLYEAIKGGGQLEFSRYSSLLFHPLSKNQKLQRERLIGLATDLRSGRLGFPKPLIADQALIRVAGEFDDSKALWGLEEIFGKQLPLVETLKSKKTPLRLLARVSKKGFTVKDRIKFHQWMLPILKRKGLDREGQDFYMEYVRGINQGIEKLDETIEEEEVIAKELISLKEDFLEKTKKSTNSIFSVIKEKYRRERVVLFCLRTKINCEKIVPSQNALKKRLKSKKLKTVISSTEYLSLMPAIAKELKADLFALLKRKKMRRSYSKAIEALLNTPLSSKEEIDIILKHSWDRVFSYEEVMKILGKKALVSLIPIAKNPRHDNQRLAIDMIGSLGSEGRSARSDLERILKETKSYSVRDSAKAALEKIK